VGQEDRAGGQSQHQGGDVRGPFIHVASIVGTISLFAAIYLATLVATGYVARITGAATFYWPSLAAAAAATVATIAIMERGRWSIGLIVPPRLAARDFTAGVGLAAALISIADAIVVASPSVGQTLGNGFPWADLFIVYVPAAMHEEVLFRGYLFQKLRAWNRPSAIVLTSIVFAAMHAGNRGIDWIAVVNLVLAGVFLALAWERYRRLWLPIGIHLGWNVFVGPVFGYGVSGFEPAQSVLRIVGNGPLWMTGGEFGIEGGVVATLVEVIGIAVLWRPRNVEC
jgi:membrane protease YdiL (CAAX protease family)